MNQAITACAFLHKDGKLFVAKRAATKIFLPNEWELPGGHIEYGEDIKDGLKRELREEFGIEVVIGETIYAFTYMNKSKNTHSVEVDFMATLKDENQVIKLNPADHSEYKFILLDEALTLWPSDDPELEAVKKGFERLNK